MRESCVNCIGQTLRVGDKVVRISGNKRVSMYRTEVLGFTESNVRVWSQWNSNTPTTCSAGRLIKIEESTSVPVPPERDVVSGDDLRLIVQGLPADDSIHLGILLDEMALATGFDYDPAELESLIVELCL